MPQLAFPCPHCLAEKVGFSPRGAVQVKPGTPEMLLFLQCEACGYGVIGVVVSNVGNVQAWINGQSSSPGDLVKTFPEPVASQCPADVPPTVCSAYLSGLDNLRRKGGTNAAAIMFRRSIEIAVKSIPDAPKSGNLKTRIDDLPADIATPAMKEWAHHVRLDANDAAHEPEDFSEDDAKQLHTFAEMFLTYAYTLPAMMKRARPQDAR